MVSTNIHFNEQAVAVHLIGTDQKLIPSLVSALRTNKFTLHNLKPSLERIELFSAEAILYSGNGNKARIPIF
ncbi:hypothetical protein [Paenibacillus sedimenti]|uniref:Uncharacterized protein n=1 Tax=Paenibacillus sedimenti TaxID=2770274 RepID=A0A926KQ28_9BACL|nr:hypothetical protein [Paenibacillus sedimenti]MBD0380258.1 hypothetical protein [Paenibacillus sedimenti]